MTVALRMLAYGVAADFTDEYVRIGESIAIESLKIFFETIVDIYSTEYLRSPNSNDIARLLRVGESRGFPGMLGSINACTGNGRIAHRGGKVSISGHSSEPTIILEAVASYDLWIWHAFFGLLGSHNDINVLDHSFIFTKLAQGHAPLVNYSINGYDYTMGYYLADGIYPLWSTFVKTIPSPQSRKNSLFATTQESTRKDVEHAFAVLQARFTIIRGPACLWRTEVLDYIMKACIILHNMIIEDECDANGVEDLDYEQVPVSIPTTVFHEPTEEFSQFKAFIEKIRNRETHSELQLDLVVHLWQRYSEL